jgi:hypothetical protein
MTVLTVSNPMNYARGMFNTARNVSRVAKNTAEPPQSNM